jgi:ribosome biogenesis GTPase
MQIVPSREDKKFEHWRENKANRDKKKKIRTDRRRDRPRRNDWMQYVTEDMDLDAWDEVDYEADQLVQEKGSGENPFYETTEALEEAEEEKGGLGEIADEVDDLEEGRVIEMGAGLARVQLDGRELLCSIRGALSAEKTMYVNVVAVGDRVLVRQEGDEDQGVIEEVLPRESVLARPDVNQPKLNQVIVANAQQLLIVASWREPKLWLELVDRYLISAQLHKLEPVICVNKIDLAEDIIEVDAEMDPYYEAGYEIILASAVTGEGVDELAEVLRDKVTVLAGMSGVGKSSLLAQIQPGLDIRIGDISEYYKQGQHTTSQVRLYPLEMGGYVVDTPGIREFGLSGLYQEDLAGYYPEFWEVGRCRFSDCMHVEEPGCAVLEAVEEGRISIFRYENYLKILETLPAFSL